MPAPLGGETPIEICTLKGKTKPWTGEKHAPLKKESRNCATSRALKKKKKKRKKESCTLFRRRKRAYEKEEAGALV